MQPITINRFPIFGAWCYVIARRLGCSEAESKSLAVTRAKLGAAARAGVLGAGKKRHAPGDSASEAPDGEARPEPDRMEFVGMRPYVVKAGGERRGLLHSGGEEHVVAPEEYDASVQRKLGEAYPEVLAVLEGLARELDPADLNQRGYHLYESFAPMVRGPGDKETRPRLGQRGVFDPARVDALRRRLTPGSR